MRRDQAHRSRWADLLAATRPLSWRERAYYVFWETFYATRDGVPWAGHWEPVLWAYVFAILTVLLAAAAAWPDRTP